MVAVAVAMLMVLQLLKQRSSSITQQRHRHPGRRRRHLLPARELSAAAQKCQGVQQHKTGLEIFLLLVKTATVLRSSSSGDGCFGMCTSPPQTQTRDGFTPLVT